MLLKVRQSIDSATLDVGLADIGCQDLCRGPDQLIEQVSRQFDMARVEVPPYSGALASRMLQIPLDGLVD